MNTSTLTHIVHRTRSFTDDVLNLSQHPTRCQRMRQAVAVAGVLGTLVQLVVWLMIGVIGGTLGAPWWLWTTVPAGAVVVALSLVDTTVTSGGAR